MPHRNKRILYITGAPLFREQIRNSRFFNKHRIKHHFVSEAAEAIEKLHDPVGTNYDFVVFAVEAADNFIPRFLEISPRPPLVVFEPGSKASHWDKDIGLVSSLDELVAYIAIHLFHTQAKTL